MNMTEHRKKISPLQALTLAQKSTEMIIGDNFEVVSANDKISYIDKKQGIHWEKWRDPYGDNFKEEEWPGAISPGGEDMEFNSDNIALDALPFELGRNIKIMQTSLGIIPLTEESRPGKVFNFWLGHTNFSITNKMVTIIDDIPGVETLSVFTRYRFRIGIAKLFKDREVLHCVNHRIAAYLALRETNPCPIKLSGEIFRKKAN